MSIEEDKIRTYTTFFYCEKDTALTDVQRWEELLDGEYDYHELGKNHFFLNQHYVEMAQVINHHLWILHFAKLQTAVPGRYLCSDK